MADRLPAAQSPKRAASDGVSAFCARSAPARRPRRARLRASFRRGLRRSLGALVRFL